MTTDANDNSEFVVIYTLWVCQFILIGLSNGLIALSILRYKALRHRKEFLIICGLSTVDFLYLLATNFGAVYRLMLIQAGQFGTKRAPSQCIRQPQIIMWLIFEPLSAVMLVVVSLDRLLAVSVPLKYFLFTKRYAYRMLGSAYGFCLVMGALGPVICIDLTEQPLVDAPCFLGQVLKAGKKTQLKWLYILYYSYIVPVMGFASVFLYVVVGVVYWKKQQQTINDITTNQQQARERQLQHRLTKTLAISTLCTFTFLVVPSLLSMTGDLFNSMPRVFSQFLWLMPQTNPLFNVLIYYKLQPELRKAIKAMLKNKQLPENLALWKRVKTIRRSAPVELLSKKR